MSRDVSAATNLPLNVDSERCYPDDLGGIAETVASSPPRERRGSRSRTTTRRATASSPSRSQPRRWPSRRKLHTVLRSRWCSPDERRTTSAASTTWTTRSRASSRIAMRVQTPCTRRALGARSDRRGRGGGRNPGQRSRTPSGPTIAELESGRRAQDLDRGALAGAAYGALVAGARELQADGTSRYTETNISRDALLAAFAEPCRRAHPKSSSSATGRPSGAAREGTPVAPTFR